MPIIDEVWLPEEYRNELHVEHSRGGDAGTFTGGGWKLIWHITVSRWDSVDGMLAVLKNKRAEPHIVIGGRPGVQNPVVIQMIPFNLAGRSVEHTLPQETNRANAIQVEICAQPGSMIASRGTAHAGHDLFGLPDFDHVKARMTADDEDLCMAADHPSAARFASGVASWTENTYNALGNLGYMISRRTRVPTTLARKFTNTNRYTGQGFVDERGHLGHQHVPGNTHVDPTKDFQGSTLIDKILSAPNNL